MFTSQLLFIGTTEMLLIAGVALLLFGGKKLPEMMRGMGQGVKEFKKGMREVSEPIEEVKETIKEAKDTIHEAADLGGGQPQEPHLASNSETDGRKGNAQQPKADATKQA